MSAVRNKKNKMIQKIQILLLLICSFNVFSSPFTDNGDGTVKDVATNLVWQKCTAGLSGTNCSGGSATTFTWVNAISYCNSLSLAGKTWRLPNTNETQTIIDYTKTNPPTIDSVAFPATLFSAGKLYWASTTNASNTANASDVDFNTAILNYGTKTNNAYVRCVSGP